MIAITLLRNVFFNERQPGAHQCKKNPNIYTHYYQINKLYRPNTFLVTYILAGVNAVKYDETIQKC